MPFSHHPAAEAADTPLSDLPLVGERYVLRRCMAETALGKVYWACDQHKPQPDDAACNALIFTVLPALARNSVFEQALRQVLPAYQQENATQPTILADGKETDGTRWLVLQNIRGMLLSERLQELDDRGMPPNEAFEILYGISHAIGSHPPQGVFGFLEPGAILGDGHEYCLLNAPVVAALRLASNGIISNPQNRQTFHSSFISPEVALGDQAESRDDTFSLACIAYYLFQGHAPFGNQTTLEAAVRNASPAVIAKLKPEMWAALRQGMSLKREQRQASPPLLLQGLQQRARPRLLLPMAAFSVLSLVAYAGYQIFSDNEPVPAAIPTEAALPANTVIPTTEETLPSQTPTLVNEPGLPPVADQETAQAAAERRATETAAKAQEDADRLAAMQREVQAQVASELAAATAANTAKTAEQQKQIDTWLKQAQTAVREGKLLSNDITRPAAANYLTQVLELDPENITAKKLSLQMVDDLHREAEGLLKARRYDAANEVLLDSDKLITEFNLTDSVQRQAQLEIQADQSTQETNKAKHYLQSAERAMGYNNVMQGDERSESAIGYLSALFEAYPDHPEGTKLLKRIIRQQHEQASGALQKRNNDEARRYLNDSQKLIGRYTLDDMVENQLDLEKRYRDKQLEGIFPSTNPAPSADNTKPAPSATNATPRQPPEKRRGENDKPTTAPGTPATVPTEPPAVAPAIVPTEPPAVAPATVAAPTTEQPAPAAVTPAPAEPAAPTETVPSTPQPETAPAPTADTTTPVVPAPAETVEPPPATPAPVPVTEAPVSPDLPIATTPAIPESVEMPPTLLDQPQVNPPVEPAPPLSDPTTLIDSAPEVATPPPANAPTGFEIPAGTGNNSGNSFTPDVQGVDELPVPDEVVPENRN